MKELIQMLPMAEVLYKSTTAAVFRSRHGHFWTLCAAVTPESLLNCSGAIPELKELFRSNSGAVMVQKFLNISKVPVEVQTPPADPIGAIPELFRTLPGQEQTRRLTTASSKTSSVMVASH